MQPNPEMSNFISTSAEHEYYEIAVFRVCILSAESKENERFTQRIGTNLPS